MAYKQSDYSKKLLDPRWQKLRLEVMQANDFCCEKCGNGDSTLHVHHKAYFKDHEPWDYYPEQLAVLCENCHESMHCFDDLKWVCSYSKMDGPQGRKDASFLLAGFFGIPYEGLLTITGESDIEHHRKLYAIGSKASDWNNNEMV
jgi:hypothetical protein